MSRKDQRIESLFRDLAPPGPPPRLRDRVMEPAREALRQDPAPDIWSRLWNSRPLRLAWSASVAVLVLCHLGLTLVQSSANHRRPPGPFTAGSALPNDELDEVMDLPRLRSDIRPLAGVLRAPADDDNDGTKNRSLSEGAEAMTEENSA